MNDLEEAVLLFIRHIRPDGYIYPFSVEESLRLREIADNIYDKNLEVQLDGNRVRTLAESEMKSDF